MPLLKDRFDAKWRLDEATGCWLWTDAPNGEGYGLLGVGGRAGTKVYAHRLAWELYVGPIPAGLQIDHVVRAGLHLQAVREPGPPGSGPAADEPAAWSGPLCRARPPDSLPTRASLRRPGR